MNSSSSLRTFAELVAIHAAAGNGYLLPSETQAPVGWFIASGVPDDLKLAMRTAESNFHEEQEAAMAPVKAKIEALELIVAKHRASKAPKRTGGSPAEAYASGFSPHTSEDQLQATVADPIEAEAELRELKEIASKLTFITYRDPDVHRSSLLDMLKRSRFNAMGVMDDNGHLMAHASLSSTRFMSVMSWSAMSVANSNEAAFLRSSSTGGTNIFTLSGAERPAFSLVSLPNKAAVANLKRKLRKTVYAALRGHTLLLDAEDTHTSRATLDLTNLPHLIRNVYTAQGDTKVAVTLSQASREKWEELHDEARRLDAGQHENVASDAAKEAVGSMLCRPTQLLYFALRAVITQALLSEAVNLGGPRSGRQLEIQIIDMVWCGEVFQQLMMATSGLAALDTRRANLEQARNANRAQAYADMVSTAPKLEKVISDCGGKASLREVTRTIGAKTAEAIVEAFPARFIILHEPMKSGGRVRTYFTLRENALQDPDEAKARLEAAQAAAGESEPDPVALKQQLVMLQKMADMFSSGAELAIHGVPVDRMTPAQVSLVPHLLQTFPDELRLVPWQDTSVLPGSAYDAVTDIEDGMPVLWIRYNAQGRPTTGWKLWPKYGLQDWDDAPPGGEP